jgi:hypothetical protein
MRNYWLITVDGYQGILIDASTYDNALKELADGMDPEHFEQLIDDESFKCVTCTAQILMDYLHENDDGSGWTLNNNITLE